MKFEPREKQYQALNEINVKEGRHSLGLMMNQVWHEDPRRLSFVLSRYKFVAKMLEGFNEVLEVGCGDGFPSHIVAQTVHSLSLTDFDPYFIDEAKQNSLYRKNIKEIFQHDFTKELLRQKYDAIYMLDVLEHIDKASEAIFLENIAKSLVVNGVAIFGIPTLESQIYASPQSKEGHVNCKSGSEFRQVLKSYFENVFMFSMNDELVHTGFNKMAHYLIGICVTPRGIK